MDIKSLKKIIKKSEIKFIVPTHIFGNICDIKEVIGLAKKNKIFVLEDAAQALGAKIGSEMIGSFGDASIISFGYSKIIDCGGGGAVLTNNYILYNVKLII